MSAVVDLTAQRPRVVARRWPRFAWDHRGLSRWSSFDESYWTSVLALGLFLSTAYLDVLLWRPGIEALPVIGELGMSTPGRVLLVVLLLVNGWVVDRLLAMHTPAELRAVSWLRGARAILAAVPLLGLAVVPLWQRLVRNPPSWVFGALPGTALDLEGRLPSGLGPRAFQSRVEARLKAWSQRLAPQVAWLVGCQIAPWFSALAFLGRRRSPAAVIVCVLLHAAGAGAALVYSRLRGSVLQMTPGRALAFRLLPLGLLLPVPFSFLPLILWLPASEESREERGVIQTLYRARAARRHPLAAARRPHETEILGETEQRRRRAAAAKIFFLFLESAALSRLAAGLGIVLLPVWALPASPLLLLVFCSALPGLALWLTGLTGRIHERARRLATLANHPSAVSLTLVPPVFLLGVSSGVFDASSQSGTLASLFLLIGFLGAFATLVAAMGSFLMSLFFGAPDRPYTGKVVALFLFLMVGVLSPVLAQPKIFLGLLCVGAVASPLVGAAIAARCLAPFRLRDAIDPRLPVPMRALLRAVALVAILPLGGLALPWSGEVRRRRGPELDRWAARLRELST